MSESSQNEYSRSRLARESEAALNRLVETFDENPAAMEYFYDLFRRVYCRGEELPGSGVRVGTTCIHVPDELIYAVGARPVRLCNGSYHYDQIGADFMPAKSCPLVRATLGALLSEDRVPRAGKLDLIVNPTSCDQKKKASAAIAAMGHAVYDLELPNGKDSEAARVYWQRSVRDLAVRLSQLTGQRLKRNRLAEAMALVRRAEAAFRALDRLRERVPSVILGKDAFLVTNAFFFDEIERWTEAVEALNRELEERAAGDFAAAQLRAPRILFTGSPPVFPNLKLPLLIEEAGGVVVADETCSANRMLNGMAASDEWLLNDMVDALADKYLKPCTCPIFTHNDDRLRRLLDLARRFLADGVVYQTLAGCQVYDMEQRSVSEHLKREGIPMLYIETDYSPDDAGQLSTRVEAFIESINARKKVHA